MSCKTELEYKKELRKSGLSPESTMRVIEIIKRDGTKRTITAPIVHGVIQVGHRNYTEAKSIEKYQSEIIKLTQDTTGFIARENEDFPQIVGNLSGAFSIATALYSESRDEIHIMEENSKNNVEQKVRANIYNEYIDNNDISYEDITDEVLASAELNSDVDIEAATKFIINIIDNKDRMHEIAHEAVHAGALLFMKDPANKDSVQMKRIEDLYRLALSKEKIINAGMLENDEINQYWMTNVHEFVAEGLSNPLFINVLSKIRYGERSKLSTIFKEFIDTLISMIGVKDKVAHNMHEYLLDSYASILESKVGDKNGSEIRGQLLVTSDNYKELMAKRNATMKDNTEQRTDQETQTIIGSYDMDSQLQENIDNGTYKKIEGMEGVLGLVSDVMNIKGMMEHELMQAVDRGFNPSKEHYEYVGEFIDSVTGAMKNAGVDEVSHKFETYQTDNEFTTAMWKDGLGLENGKIDAGKIVVLLGKKNPNGTESLISNNSELLMHEFSHSATEFAMRQDGVLSRKVSKVQREVMKQLTADMLLSQIEHPTVSERKRATELLRYMNGNPSEFLAYAVSNQQVFTAMQNMQIQIDTFFVENDPDANGFIKTIDMIKSIINKVVSVISSGPTAATAFNKTLQEVIARNMQIRAKMYTGETFDDYASKVTGGKYEKVDNFMKEGISKVETKLADMKILSPRTKDSIQDFVNHMSEIKFIQDVKESGVMQSIMHTMFRQTTDKEFAASFQLIRKIKTDNDKHQNSLKEINANLVHSWFKDIPAGEREAITDLLAADVSSLGYSKEVYADLLESDAALDAVIAGYHRSIGENEYLNQARDLGWYMVHGTAKNPLLQTNAYRIYHRMYEGTKQRGLGDRNSDEMISNIDKLASLYAMKYIDQSSKNHIISLLRNKDAVSKSNDITDTENYHVFDLAMQLYDTSLANEKADFGESYSKMMDKGYLRKAYKLPMKTRIVPESLIREMIDRGYSPESTFSRAATDMRDDGEQYHIMYAPDYSASRTQGAIHDVGYFDKVQQMSDIYDGHNVVYEKNTKLVANQSIRNRSYDGLKRPFVSKSVESMMSGTEHLLPVHKLDGSIVDYSIPISKADGENHMAQDRDIASVLAATVTHRSAKGKAIRGNISVINHLLATEIEHEDDKNYVVLRRSTELEKSSGKPYKYDKQYAMIPEYTRDYINSQRDRLGMPGDPSSIRIHKDMIDDFIGYKDASVADFQLGEGGKYFDMGNHPVVALRAEQLQYWLKKMIARYKTILVILNPQVVFGNAISNFNMATVHGIDPVTYTKMFIKHWKNLDDYTELHNELMRTESERDAGMKGLDGKIESLRIQLKANAMHNLMEDGQFNMIIEDLNTYNNKEDHVEYQKRRLMEKALGKEGSEKAKKAIELVVLTKDSAAFKGIEKLTTYNDIVNRAIVMDKLRYDMEMDIQSGKLDSAGRDARERENMDYIDQLFVNYSYLDNRYIKYANDMGLILFTKYFFRALKTLKQVYDKKPLSMTMFLGLEVTETMPAMFDENPYSNYGKPFDALANRVGPIAGHNFMDMMAKLLSPASFQVI